MGLFDFGTKAQVEELASHIGVGMQLIEEEMRKTGNQSSPTIRGLALGLLDERNKLMALSSQLAQSTRDSLKIRYNNQKIPYFTFIQEMKRVSDRVDNITGINFFNSTMTKNGITRTVR